MTRPAPKARPAAPARGRATPPATSRAAAARRARVRARRRERRWQLGLLLLTLVLGLAAIGPYADHRAASARVDGLTSQRDALSSEVGTLEQRSEELADPEALELIAREDLGLVRPGEIPYVVEGPDELATAEPAVPQPSPAATPWWQSLLDRLGDLVG